MARDHRPVLLRRGRCGGDPAGHQQERLRRQGFGSLGGVPLMALAAGAPGRGHPAAGVGGGRPAGSVVVAEAPRPQPGAPAGAGRAAGHAGGTLSFGCCRPPVAAVVARCRWCSWRCARCPCRAPMHRRRHAGQGGCWLTVSGFTSFVAHAGGPPLAFYLLPPKELPPMVPPATSPVYFALINLSKWGPYAWLGADRRATCSPRWCCRRCAAGRGIGVRFVRRMPQALFYRTFTPDWR